MNYIDWEQMKIAGMPEQNKQIDEMRKSWETQQANNLLVSQLQTINNNLQTQINEAKEDAKNAKKKAFWASFRSWISLAFTAGSLIVAIVALCLR